MNQVSPPTRLFSPALPWGHILSVIFDSFRPLRLGCKDVFFISAYIVGSLSTFAASFLPSCSWCLDSPARLKWPAWTYLIPVESGGRFLVRSRPSGVGRPRTKLLRADSHLLLHILCSLSIVFGSGRPPSSERPKKQNISCVPPPVAFLCLGLPQSAAHEMLFYAPPII